jgi:hypothetical protein
MHKTVLAAPSEGEKLMTVHDGDMVATPIGRWHCDDFKETDLPPN